MAKPILFSLSVLCLLAIIFHVEGACERCPPINECRLDRLNALEPDNSIQCEAGRIDSWNPNHDQFECAGVAVYRHIIDRNGLSLPVYSNAPKLVYIVQGRGMLGVMLPGCAETFQESQESRPTNSRQRDMHQKIHQFRAGDIIAVPAGVSHWCYNEGNEPVIAVSVFHTASKDNQLDNIPRNFYIAGNPADEFGQQFRSAGERGQGPRGCNNMFCGLDTRLIAEAFNIDEQLARKLQSENDFRGNIVRVEGGQMQVVRPPMTPQESEEVQGCQEYERPCRRAIPLNGIEETYCTMKLRENIADSSRADVFVPQVGRLSTVNSHNLPILRWLQLSASHVTLFNNAMRLPHWNMNAHAIMYVVRGQGRVQVVDENGNNIFDGSVREGQLLTVPQNFMVVKMGESSRFEYVTFKTNDNAITTDAAGRTSALRGMPVEVVANAYKVSIDEARRIKFQRQETTFATPSGRRAIA